MNTTRVIILGGGPVGLGSALELARFGIRSVLIEKHEGTSWHPKTRNFNTRTMEIAKGWGEAVYKRLRNVDTPPGWKSPIRFLYSATGEEFGTIDSKGFEGPGPDVSPAEPIMSSQDLIEEIMLDGARASGLVDLRFSTEATRLLKGGDEDHVVLEIKDMKTGAVETIEAEALVAADGADSFVRKSLGLELEGSKDLSHIVNCYFSADIEPHLGERIGVLFFVTNPGARGVLQPLNGAGKWLCQINVRADEWSLDEFTKDRAREWVRAAAGIEDLEVDVHSLGLWKLNATVVERMVQGRIVICGDAAHQFPPTGGLGVNTGLQSMHNVMWKLAAFLNGDAPWSLVETYETERKDVSKEIVNQSLTNSFNVGLISKAAVSGSDSGLSTQEAVRATRRYGNHLGVEFGARYASSVITPDGTEPPSVEDTYSDYVQSASPGCRAPHVQLGLTNLSTLDLIGTHLTLLVGREGEAWSEAAHEASSRLSFPIDCFAIGKAGLTDPDNTFEAAYGVQSDGAVLVRPDGHVAWRKVSGPADHGSLHEAASRALGR